MSVDPLAKGPYEIKTIGNSDNLGFADTIIVGEAALNIMSDLAMRQAKIDQIGKEHLPSGKYKELPLHCVRMSHLKWLLKQHINKTTRTLITDYLNAIENSTVSYNLSCRECGSIVEKHSSKNTLTQCPTCGATRFIQVRRVTPV
jgi:DNA-directed RNA polymerase subunit RPC12/RpoP